MASGLGALSDAGSRLFVSYLLARSFLLLPTGHRFSGRAHGTLEGHRAGGGIGVASTSILNEGSHVHGAWTE
jgi:hypothetical protein